MSTFEDITRTASRRSCHQRRLGRPDLFLLSIFRCARRTSRSSRRTRQQASSRPMPSSASTTPARPRWSCRRSRWGRASIPRCAMILAEELDADFAKVALEHAPPNDKLYGNPMFGIQVTGNSNSIRAFWKPLRIAGAAARAMLVQAAAQQWQVEPASCTAANGEVSHAAERAHARLWRSGRRGGRACRCRPTRR